MSTPGCEDSTLPRWLFAPLRLSPWVPLNPESFHCVCVAVYTFLGDGTLSSICGPGSLGKATLNNIVRGFP